MEPNQNLLSSDIQVDSIAHSHLKETAMWAKLLGIVGFVLSVIIGLAGIFAGANLQSFEGLDIGGGAIMISFIYLIIAGVYFALSLYMFRFSTKMKAALQTIDQENFNNALNNLKLAYRIMGIITIIYLGIMALALIASIGSAAFAS